MMEIKRGGKRFNSFWLVLALLPFLSACGVNRGLERDDLQSRVLSPHAPLIAVLPFENLSEHPNAGEILTRLMATALYRQKSFNIREEPKWVPGGADKDVNSEKLPSTMPEIQQLAHKLGADAALLGSVTEFHYQHGLREEPVVGLSVRLVRSCDGKVVWAASRSVSGKGLFRRESLNQVAQRMVDLLAKELGMMTSNDLRCVEQSLEMPGSQPTMSGEVAEGKETGGGA